MKKNLTTPIFLTSLIVSLAAADPVTIKSGNVIGTPVHGNMAHHMQQTQHDFSRLVSVETDGDVTIDILEGKRPDIPVFRMPEMTKDGSVIQATAVPSFFLPLVPEMKIFEIPYLFRDSDHAKRYPTSNIAGEFTALIEERYDVKVLGQFLVAHNVAITSTNKPMRMPGDFAGRYVNDDFESFAPMWVNVQPSERYSIGYTEAVEGALHSEERLDTSIGMLQNIYVQKQYTKFPYATIAPGFYTFFYTYMMNQDVWDNLDGQQQAGILSAARAVQDLAFDNERATAIYHTALNRALNVSMHLQTPRERDAWEAEFSDKVRDGILEASDDPEKLSNYVERIRAL